MNDITQLIHAVEHGDSGAAETLLPLVYEELRKLARFQLMGERPGQTLQATALVHEAYLKLVRKDDHSWESRRHFFRTAAEAMRRILIDQARRKQAVRHGGGLERVDVHDIEFPAVMKEDRLLELNEALEQFEAVDASKAALLCGINHRGSCPST